MTKKEPEIRPHSEGHVMIVDDEAANLDYLQDAIQRLNCKMSVFPNGEMALDAAREEPPDHDLCVRIIANLLDNTLKYSPRDKMVAVSVEAKSRERCA